MLLSVLLRCDCADVCASDELISLINFCPTLRLPMEKDFFSHARKTAVSPPTLNQLLDTFC